MTFLEAIDLIAKILTWVLLGLVIFADLFFLVLVECMIKVRKWEAEDNDHNKEEEGQ